MAIGELLRAKGIISTEQLNKVSLLALPARTQALHGLLDHQVGLLDNLAQSVGEKLNNKKKGKQQI